MGEGGIIVPPDDYFRVVKEWLDAEGVLFIADEVQSGFGRTGHMFAIEHYGVEPDIICMAKGIANGWPLGRLHRHPRDRRRLPDRRPPLDLRRQSGLLCRRARQHRLPPRGAARASRRPPRARPSWAACANCRSISR